MLITVNYAWTYLKQTQLLCMICTVGKQPAFRPRASYIWVVRPCSSSTKLNTCSKWVLIVGYNCELKCMSITMNQTHSILTGTKVNLKKLDLHLMFSSSSAWMPSRTYGNNQDCWTHHSAWMAIAYTKQVEMNARQPSFSRLTLHHVEYKTFCTRSTGWALFGVNFRPSQRIEAIYMGGGQIFDTRPFFVRLW